MPLLLVPTPRVLSVLKHVACIADGTLFGSYSGGVAMWPLEARVPYDRCHLASLLLAARLSLKSVEADYLVDRAVLRYLERWPGNLFSMTRFGNPSFHVSGDVFRNHCRKKQLRT